MTPNGWRDYETAAGNLPIQYGAPCGAHLAFEDSPLRMAEEKSDQLPSVVSMVRPTLRGYATRFTKTHNYAGRVEIFAPGAFSRSLSDGSNIRFLKNHDVYDQIGCTDDRLVLMQDEYGLAFDLDLTGHTELTQIADLVSIRGWDQMSVGYRTLRAEEKKFDGLDYTVIHEAELAEISLVKVGAVKETHVTLIDGADALPFKLAVRGLFVLNDAATTNLNRAIAATLRCLRKREEW